MRTYRVVPAEAFKAPEARVWYIARISELLLDGLHPIAPPAAVKPASVMMDGSARPKSAPNTRIWVPFILDHFTEEMPTVCPAVNVASPAATFPLAETSP